MNFRSASIHGVFMMAICVAGSGYAAGQTNVDAGSTVALVTGPPAKLAAKNGAADAATRVYTIGCGDLLRIELNDVPGVPRTVRVQPDGTIGYPLAGANVAVNGKTTAEAEALISDAVKTLSKGGVRIKVAEYFSHTVSVIGLVGDPGTQQIQRDAVPFFVIKAMSAVDPRATAVRIFRSASARSEKHELSEAGLDSILIFPGDSIEFGTGAF